MWSISTAFSFVSYMCCVSSMCYANMEFGLFNFIAWMCSLKHVRKFLFALCNLMVSYYILAGKCHFR
jgi:succinate-acetate transporter protein